MKGLILKDLYMTFKYMKSLILIIAVFLAVSVWGSDNNIFRFYPCIIASSMPVTLLAYDDRSKWSIYSRTLPYTARQLVSVKYIMGMIFSFSAYILSVCSTACYMVFNDKFNMNELAVTASTLLIIMLIIPTAVFPLSFRFGAEKGRMLFVVIAIALLAAVMISIPLSSVYSDSAICPTFNIYFLIMDIISIILYVISWLISVKLYKKREL